MPEQVDSWTSPGWDKRYPLWHGRRVKGGWGQVSEGMSRLVGTVDNESNRFFIGWIPKMTSHIWSRKYWEIHVPRTSMLNFGGFMVFLCPIWSCVNLNRKSSWDVLQICWAMAGPKSYSIYLVTLIFFHIPHGIHQPRITVANVLGTSPWPFKAAFHECRTSTGWMTCEKNKDPPLFEKEHHHIQQKTRWSDSIVIAHLWRGHFVHWCILQTKSWVNMSELNIYNYNISANWEFPLKHYWKKKLCSGTSRCIWRVSLVQMLFSFTSNHWKPRKKYQGLMFFSAGWMEK